jgi:hypothetical protein
MIMLAHFEHLTIGFLRSTPIVSVRLWPHPKPVIHLVRASPGSYFLVSTYALAILAPLEMPISFTFACKAEDSRVPILSTAIR